MATAEGNPWTWKTDAIYSQAKTCPPFFSPCCDNKLHTEVTVWAVEMFMCDNLLKYHRTWYSGSSLDLCKGTNVRTEPPPAWMRFQDRYLDGKAAFWEDASCHCWGWGAVVEVMDAEKLSGWQEREEAIWAFWDCVRVHLQIGWQQQRGHVVRVDLASCSRARAGHPHNPYCPRSHLPSTTPDCLVRSI